MAGSQLYEKIRNRKQPGTFRPKRSSSAKGPRLINTFEVEMSQVFSLPVAFFARINEFRSYVDATMNLYNIIQYGPT